MTDRIRVEVGEVPDPFLLRAAIAARLAGRPWTGPDAAVAAAVAEAVERAGATGGAPTEREGDGWR